MRDFHSLVQANELLHAWVMGEAGNRIHGSTRERPLKLFTGTEQGLLQALPAMVPECATWEKAKLHPNCHVQFAYCHYSAPFALIGQTLWLEITPHALRIYRDHELVAIHPRQFKHGDKLTVNDHLRAAQGLIRLGDQYGRRRLESACARALTFGAPQYRTVKQILSQGLDQQPDLIEIVELEAPYRGEGRFSRNPADLLH